MSLLFALLAGGSAVVLFARNRGNEVHRVFCFTAVAASFWMLLDSAGRLSVFFEIYVTDIFFNLGELFLLTAGALLVHFSRIFPRRVQRRRRQKTDERRSFGIVPVTLGVAVLLGLLSFTPFYVDGRVYRPSEGTYDGENGVIFFLNRLFLLVTLVLSIREQFRFQKFHERDPRRVHSQYFLIGLVATGVTGSALYAYLFVFPGEPTVHLLRSAVVSGFLLFVVGILSNRSINLRGALYRNAVSFVSALALLIPVFFLTNYLLAVMYAASPFLLAIVLCALFLLFHQAFRLFLPYVQKRIFSLQARSEAAVADFSASILNLASGETTDVRRRMMDFLDSLYSPRFFAFYVLDRRRENPVLEQDRDLTRLADYESIPPGQFPDELQLFLNEEKEAREGGLVVDLLARSERSGNPGAAAAATRLGACGAEIVLPFRGDPGENPGGPPPMEAVLLMGLNRNGHPLDHTDLFLLQAMRAPALLAMKNQELLTQTMRLQERLEEENRRITRRLTQELPGVTTSGHAATFVFKPGGIMASLMEQAERFAGRPSPVLITGETGTGKEQIARTLHGLSGRIGAIVTINCSAIPQDLIENELFGHEKGAYTGAHEASEGTVARAENGTLFLDEIGEMPLTGQVKLLRLVQQGEYERIGSSETLKTNARFIFATNRDLEAEVARGQFRSDLFYRINTFEIRVPPLRERKEDIPLLVDHFLWMAGQTFHRPGLVMTDEARDLLMRHNWPGNVRELENVILRAVVLSDQDVLDTASLPVMFRDELDFSRKKSQLDRIATEQSRLEKELLLEALERTGGNQRKAAEILNISRGSLQYKMKQYGLVQG